MATLMRRRELNSEHLRLPAQLGLEGIFGIIDYILLSNSMPSRKRARQLATSCSNVSTGIC